MDVFLNHVRQSSDEGENPAARSTGRPASRRDVRTAAYPTRCDGPLTLAEDAYREERAFDARRARQRKLVRVLGACALLVAVPAAMVLAFVASYCAVVIISGGTPDELVTALAMLFERIRIASADALGTSFGSFGC